MTKNDLAAIIAKKTEKSTQECVEFIEAFMDSVMKSNAKGETIYLRGFGSFGLKKRAQKIARDINKQKQVIVPEHTIPYFKPGRDFKNLVK